MHITISSPLIFFAETELLTLIRNKGTPATTSIHFYQVNHRLSEYTEHYRTGTIEAKSQLWIEPTLLK